jgi:hypothetical protein
MDDSYFYSWPAGALFAIYTYIEMEDTLGCVKNFKYNLRRQELFAFYIFET